MKCACTLTPVLALAGLAALGFGGYNVMKTGCPLGTCADRPAAAVSTVSQTVAAPADPACNESPCGATGGLAAGDAQLVAATDQPVPDCAGMKDCADAKNCPHMANCDGKGQCPMKTAGAKCPHGASPATQVADKGAPETPKN